MYITTNGKYTNTKYQLNINEKELNGNNHLHRFAVKICEAFTNYKYIYILFLDIIKSLTDFLFIILPPNNCLNSLTMCSLDSHLLEMNICVCDLFTYIFFLIGYTK